MTATRAGVTSDKIENLAAGATHTELIEWSNRVVAHHAAGLLTMTADTRPAIMLGYAVVYAINGWEVFPLGARKAPRIKSAHPQGDPLHGKCKGACGRDGHGLHDATTDIPTICRWWSEQYRGANIGGRVPAGLFVLDLDPRKPGHTIAVAKLTHDHGPLPATLTTVSGRGDGGCHLFYRRPAGRLSTAGLGPEFAATADPGLDIKDRGGLIVVPPSIHHVTGRSYTAIDRAIASLPASLITAITVSPTPPAPRRRRRTVYTGQCLSPTEFNDTHTWRDILEPEHWTCLDPDGARWRHPTATAAHSASITGGRIYVYSPNTPFEATGGGFRHGYDKFDADQLLNRGTA